MLMPALFNRMSSRPISRLMNSPIRRTAAGSVRSPGWTWAAPPVPRIHPATSSRGASRRPVSTIVAPSPASAMAAASPMPLPPPVTHTTLSASLGTPYPRLDCRGGRLSPRNAADEGLCASRLLPAADHAERRIDEGGRAVLFHDANAGAHEAPPRPALRMPRLDDLA